MGHIDHGKTTLLDYVRKTNITAGEAGGITQSIGAYEITHNGKPLTFIDTPGHEAFAVLRGRGANVADIAILVVAADDGVKPQTEEALKHIKEAGIPYIVAINKIDLPAANVEKTKQELLKAGIYLEGLGGDVSYQEISAKQGTGVNELLDLILLQSEMEGLEADPGKPAEGVVLTSTRDPRKGIIAGVIVKDGTLHAGGMLYAASGEGRVKVLQDTEGETVKEAGPGKPVLVSGFKNLPSAGEAWSANPLEAKPAAAKMERVEAPEGSVKAILKAGEAGSLDALADFVRNKAGEELFIIDAGVGGIYENDVRYAKEFGAVIISFAAKMDKAARALAETSGVTILEGDVIYELGDALEKYLAARRTGPTRGITVKGVFGKKEGRQIVGGLIDGGAIRNQEPFTILDGEQEIGTGKIINLQSHREDVPEANEGEEVGLLVEATAPIKLDNRLVFS